MGKAARRFVVLALVLAPAVASAQGAAPTSGGAAPAAPAGGGGAAPAAPAAAPPAAGAPAGAAAADTPKPPGNTGGYSFSDKPAPRRAAAVKGVRRHASGPVAMLPGFEQTGDGGSRLFVQLSQSVQVEERKAQGAITYVLKGAHVTKWNNTNSLVTVHFNTPVSRARLVPQGSDLLFIVELRAAAAPTFKITEAPDKTSLLTVDFPKGDYLTGNESSERLAGESGPKQPKRKGGKKGAPAPAPAGGEPARDDAPADTTGPTP